MSAFTEVDFLCINTLRTLPGFVFNGFAEDENTQTNNMREAGTDISKTLLKLNRNKQ